MREIPGQLCLAALLEKVGSTIIQLVCHTHWSSRAPVHGNPGHGMVGCYQQEVELQDIPSIHQHYIDQNVGRLQGLRDQSADHEKDGPLGERSPLGPGGVSGGKGCCQGGQEHKWRIGKVIIRYKKLPQYSAVEEAPQGRPSGKQ